MSRTRDILKQLERDGGVVRPVWGLPNITVEHSPRYPKPWVSHEQTWRGSNEWRYSGTQVWVDTRDE